MRVYLLQTVVLMLFNDADTLSYPELKEASGMDEGELKRTLQSLALGKMRVLAKTPKVHLLCAMSVMAECTAAVNSGQQTSNLMPAILVVCCTVPIGAECQMHISRVGWSTPACLRDMVSTHVH